MPVRVGPAERRGGALIGAEVQQHERRRSPCRPVFCAGGGADEPPQPGRCGARHGHRFIPRPRDNCNRHHPRNPPPVAPMVELGDIVRAHDPHEPPFRVTADEFCKRIDGVTGVKEAFYIGHFDDAPPRLHPCRSKAGFVRGHALGRLQRIARRHKPPYFVQPQRLRDIQADPPVPPVRRIERSAKKACRDQGRTCPVPRTSHL